MSKRTIIIAIVGVIALIAVVYLTNPKKNSTGILTPPSSLQENTTVQEENNSNLGQNQVPPSPIKEPSATAGADEIIDYIVDGITSNETNAVNQVIESTSATPSSDVSISTNF